MTAAALPRALELDLVGLAVERLKTARRYNRTKAPGDEGYDCGPLVADTAKCIERALQIGDSQPPRVPAIVVYLAADDASESAAPSAGAYQRVTATLAVVHVVDAANTPRRTGDAGVEPLTDLVGRTRAALNGWRPEQRPRQDVLQLRRGRLLEIADGRAVWQDEYTVSWRATRVQEQGD